jgi:hypothetical protein
MEICLTTHAYNRIKERAPEATFYRRMIWRAYCAKENAKRNAKVFEYIKYIEKKQEFLNPIISIYGGFVFVMKEEEGQLWLLTMFAFESRNVERHYNYIKGNVKLPLIIHGAILL